MQVRTRFAPSPTGYLHIGGARTALFSWAFARKHGGKFVLRIEDTDLERSTQESVKAILDGLDWLGIDYDEGPFYQMQRLERYREVAEGLLRNGHAYYCYASKEDLETMREAQRKRGEKPRYDGRWRDSKAAPPKGATPVVRFKNPLSGETRFDDLIKGSISVQNTELDDLVILRADGVPTYNFGVVVDDIDMNITHVIRGDDHVNNTPRQINILNALGVEPPQYAHAPMILGADGERLSKRHGAVSVMQYKEDGYLPEALVNYLARLGWAHGDAEMFSVKEFVEWFDFAHISKSPAQFNPEKLRWLNHQYLKSADSRRLADLAVPFLKFSGCEIDAGPDLVKITELLKERATTVAELADASIYFFRPLEPSPELKSKYFTAPIKAVLIELAQQFSETIWKREAIDQTLKSVVNANGLKLGQVAMPLRVMITGETQTPSIDTTLELIGKTEVLLRMKSQLEHYPA